MDNFSKEKPDKILVVSVSYSGFIHNTVFESIAANMRIFKKRYPNIELARMWMCGHFVDRARQKAHENALEKGFTHIWWHDDDIVMPDDSLVKLYENHEDIVGSILFQRSEPYAICSYRADQKYGIDDWDHFRSLLLNDLGKGLKTVDATGTGCMLMKTDIIDQLDKPWWYWPKKGAEDINFCVRLRKLGKLIYVDTNVIGNHLSFDPTAINKSIHNIFLENTKKMISEAPQIKDHPEFYKLEYLLSG